jgi:hypothetical protein
MPFVPKSVRSGEVRLASYMREKYGPVSGIYTGIRPLIFISDFNLVNDLYKVLKHNLTNIEPQTEYKTLIGSTLVSPSLFRFRHKIKCHICPSRCSF